MKRITIYFLTVIFTLTIFSIGGCKRGENDPWLSFKSRNSRISAVWTLETGTAYDAMTFDEEFVWLDNKCEDATGIDQYKYTDNELKTYTYTNSQVQYQRSLTTNRELIGIYDAKEWEDAQNIQRSLNYSFDLTIKGNGEYVVYITYNLFEDDFPQIPDDEGEMQFGNTFTGTYEYSDTWYWMDNSVGTKSAIKFAGFPTIQLHLGAFYQLPDLTFDYNWVDSVSFSNDDRIFEIDKLENKELTMLYNNIETGFFQEIDKEFQATEPGGDDIDCEGTTTYNTIYERNYIFEFISDGKNVDE